MHVRAADGRAKSGVRRAIRTCVGGGGGKEGGRGGCVSGVCVWTDGWMDGRKEGSMRGGDVKGGRTFSSCICARCGCGERSTYLVL